MSEPTAIDAAIEAWRTKYQVKENDPLAAALELVEIYLKHQVRFVAGPNESQPSYQEFRETVCLLERSAKALDAITKELIEQSRLAAQRFKDAQPVSTAGLALLTASALLAGYCICEFIRLWLQTSPSQS